MMPASLITKLRQLLPVLLLLSVSLYFLNATSYFRPLRYGKYLWLCTLPICLLTLAIGKTKFNKDFMVQQIKPWLPLFLAGIILFFYHGNFSGANVLGKFLILLLVFSLLVSTITLRLQTLFRINAFNCIVLSTLGFIQTHYLGYYVPGWDVNQNIFAGVIVLLGGFSCLSSFSQNQQEKISNIERCLYFLAGVAAIITAISTGCRTVFFTLIALLPLSIYSIKKYFQLPMRKVLLLAVLPFILLGIIILSDDLLVQRIRLILPEISQWTNNQQDIVSTSIGIRLSMYQIALFEIFPQFPLLGMGDLSGKEIANILGIHSITESYVNNWTHFHNDFLQMLVTGGICFVCLGILTFLWLLLNTKLNVLLLWLLGCGFLFGLTEVFFFRQNTFICFCTLWLFYQSSLFQRSSYGPL